MSRKALYNYEQEKTINPGDQHEEKVRDPEGSI